MKKMYNEKPSKYQNLGQDIVGAQRHSFNTYETSEEKEAKERKKQQKKNLDQLKNSILDSLTESNFLITIQDFEFKKILAFFPSYQGSQNYSKESLNELKEYVLSQKGSPDFNTYRLKFNKIARLVSRLSYGLTFASAQTYFNKQTKEQFTEINGVEKPWKLTKTFDASSIDLLEKNTKAIQFGNSLSENEREYCLQNLAESLVILNKYFNFDFKSLGFSFGARGKRGSIAHYQDSLKVLAFNRGWDGSLVHELGHAIDYSLDLVSYKIPKSVLTKYYDQLRNNKTPNMKYYRKPKEVFARLFEQFVKKEIPELTEFMQYTSNESVMPELDAEALEFLKEVLSPILK